MCMAILNKRPHWVKQAIWTTLAGLLGAMATAPVVDAAPEASKPAAVKGSDAASAYKTVDVMPDFWRFWEQAPGKPLPERVALFRQMVIQPHQALYDATVGTVDDQRLSEYLGSIDKYVPALRRLSGQLVREVSTNYTGFKKIFPDMAWSGTVYLMPSLYRFDGQTNQVEGRQALLFGPDTMARYKYAKLGVLIQHELFHLYHEQVNAKEFKEANGSPDQAPVYLQLWTEGLATYASAKLNPGASTNEVLLSAPLAQKGPALLPRIAEQLLPKLDSTAKADASRFFDGGAKSKDLPARSGYYAGMRVAEELSKTFTLAEMARLGGPLLRREIENVLITFKDGQKTPSPTPPG